MFTELRVAVDGDGVSLGSVDASAFFDLAADFARAILDQGADPCPFKLRPGVAEEGSARQVILATAEHEEGLQEAQRATLRVVDGASDPDVESPAIRRLQTTIAERFPGLKVYAIVNDVRADILLPPKHVERRLPASVETWRVQVLGARTGTNPAATLRIDGRTVDLRCSLDLAKRIGRMLDEQVEAEARLVRLDDHRRRYQVIAGELLSFTELQKGPTAVEALTTWATPPAAPVKRARVRKA